MAQKRPLARESRRFGVRRDAERVRRLVSAVPGVSADTAAVRAITKFSFA
jgi:hypothetical protein